MKLYSFIRWCPRLYRLVYWWYEKNHENKIVHQSVAYLMRWLDKLFPLLLLIFILKAHVLPKNVFLDALVTFPVLNSLFTIFTYNNWLFGILSIFLFFLARVYINSYKAYENEETIGREFHSVNHLYRDFINELVRYRKQKDAYTQSGSGAYNEVLSQMYADCITSICMGAREAMRQLINDSKCYLVLKMIDEENGNLVLSHYRAYPDLHRGRHLTRLLLAKEKVSAPNNFFQVILNNFYSMLDSGNFETWNLGLLCNDLKGDTRFSREIMVGGKFDKYKASIIIPVVVDFKIRGFLCFNTQRIGMLRKKHRHFLSGHCDQIANLIRNIL